MGIFPRCGILAAGGSAQRPMAGGQVFRVKPRWFRPWWLLLLVPLALRVARLRFNVEVLDLLPPNVPAVQGVKLYQQKFSNARELIVTVQSPERELVTQSAQAIAQTLRSETNLVSE